MRGLYLEFERGGTTRAMTKRKLAGRIGLGIAALLALIQFVPYGHSHANPPVTKAVNWNSPSTAQLASGACITSANS